MTALGGLLVHTVEVWRPQSAPDGAGGQALTWTQVGRLRARLSQPSRAERLEAGAAGVDMTHAVYFEPTADVLRGDEIRAGGPTVLEVMATRGPSVPVYLRADCRSRQREGGAPWRGVTRSAGSGP